MKILSHRGYWKSAEEKNTAAAFLRSFSLGFGTETDFRDRNGSLVISHDPATDAAMPADDFFKLYNACEAKLPLALNIKSDGLQRLLAQALVKHEIANYFIFDMSIPDTIGYMKAGLRVFTRQSEYEPVPPLYEGSHGVWIDGFNSDWVTERVIAEHIQQGKQVCLVSPDLHGRPFEAFWERLSHMTVAGNPNVMLCTDHPEEARKVFDEQD